MYKPNQVKSRIISLVSAALLAASAAIAEPNMDWIVPMPDPSVSSFFAQKLIVSDGERSIAFYSNVLGMKVLTRIEPPDAKFGEAVLGFDDNPDAGRIALAYGRNGASLPGLPPPGTPFPRDNRFTNMIFQVSDAAAVCERIKASGGEVTFPPHKTENHGWLVLAFAKDPDGHVIELLQFAPFDPSLPLFDPLAPPQDLVEKLSRH